MFKTRFYTILTEDIMNFGLEPSTNPHHRVAIRGLTRKTQTQIPDIHKAEAHPTERKIIMVKDRGGQCPCNNNDVQYIIAKYKINNIDKSPQLGKTGVTLMKTQHGNYILAK